MKAVWRVAAALVLLAPAAYAAEDKALERARKILRKTILIDGHNDLPWAIRQYEKAPHDVVAYDLRKPTPGQTDIARLRAGGVGGQFWSVYVPADVGAQGPLDHLRIQLEQIDIARQVIERYPDVLGLALTAEDVKRQSKRHRIASLLGMEGGHVIGNSLGALRAYYDLGVRYMTLTHGRTIDWADSVTDDPRHGGLHRVGEGGV